MRLLIVGISHQTAPVELRERVDFQARGVADALKALAARGSTREAVVVSTCNRAELVVACEDEPATRADLTRFFGDFNHLAPADVAPHLYQLVDLDAARHLFRVAAGLDSLVVGEPQILGQVKDPFIRSFWADEYTAYDPRFQREAIAPIQNKLGQFQRGCRVELLQDLVAVGLARIDKLHDAELDQSFAQLSDPGLHDTTIHCTDDLHRTA